MRLTTYDREGARRLGAWVGDTLVDLPEAVGHPSFPATLEGLVTRSLGSAMQAATAALSNPDYVAEALVPKPRLLPPLLLSEDGAVVRTGGELAWPASTPCEWQPEVACVIGRAGRNVSVTEASGVIFGYLLASEWFGAGDPEGSRPAAMSLGPCLVTAEGFDPAEVTVTARVNRGVWARERIGDAASRFARTIARASKEREVRPGEVFGSSPFQPAENSDGRRLARDATVEIEAGPLGTLRTRVRFKKSSPDPA